MSDLISRQAAIDSLKVAYWDDNIQSAKDDPCIVDAMTDWAIRKIKGLPTIDAVPVKHGEWIYDEKASWKYECPFCECYFPADWNYCPNCGAKMDGGKRRCCGLIKTNQ